MLKLQHFFILVSFLVATSLVACEKDEEVSEPQGGAQVSGGEAAGGMDQPEDMGLEGGQSLDQETQPTGGSMEDPEDPQGGAQGGEVLEELPVAGAQVPDPEEPVQGGSQEDPEPEVDCAPSEEDVPQGGVLMETEEGCLPEMEAGGVQESTEEAPQGGASMEQSEG